MLRESFNECAQKALWVIYTSTDPGEILVLLKNSNGAVTHPESYSQLGGSQDQNLDPGLLAMLSLLCQPAPWVNGTQFRQRKNIGDQV